jgi:predicted RNase H-like HicB family nuclease
VTILRGDKARDWEAEVTTPDAISEAMNQLLAKWRAVVKLETLQEEIIMLKERVTSLEQQGPLLVSIETLAPEPYLLLHPILAVVRVEQDEYVATWYDAGLAASGANPEEAVANLKDIIVAVHESLQPLSEEKMGPVPLRQYRLLARYVAKSK